MYKKLLIINLISFILFIHLAYSRDSIIYADYISTDTNENIIIKGNVRIVNGDELLKTEKLYIDETKDKIIVEEKFIFMDETENFYYGSSGIFSKNFNEGEIQDFSFVGSESLRMVGTKAIKKGNVDIINKGVVTPCRTLKIFGCPLWQIKASKMVHDKNDYMIYQKHSRLEILQLPVFYTPYSISPSPLRKERKSGFLYPTFVPYNSELGGNVKTPYYVNVSHDKELLITPVIYYQKDLQDIKYFYNQRTAGGEIVANLSTLTSFNNTKEFMWLKEAGLNLSVNHNINHNYQAGLKLNLQTKGTYFRKYDTQNPINYFASLSNSTYLDGYSLIEDDDLLTIETYNFQAVKTDVDNKKIPIVSPIIKYNTGTKVLFNNINYQNKFLFYNIFRDKNTKDHAYRQTRFNYDANLSYQRFWKNSRIRFESTIQTDLFSTEKKQIGNEYVSDEHIRIFPMSGFLIDNPFINERSGTIYNPKVFLSINGSNNNTNEISNELTTDNEIDISRFFSVNRYTGNDKFDNGQRIGYGLDIAKEKFYFDIAQGYQISSDSDYTKDVGMSNQFSDIVGELGFIDIFKNEEDFNTNFSYNYRYSPYEEYFYYQRAGLSNQNMLGTIGIGYVNSYARGNYLSFPNRENISFSYESVDFLEYSSFSFSTSYDIYNEQHQTSHMGYSYSDECFGLSVNYNRNFFENTPDSLSIGMNFTFIGPVPNNIIDNLLLKPLNFSQE
tara:strand:+ start:2574 stop:4751 length:2178 start_codon:yes stop_codon:yes gene_type:complete